jgi:hypothetical protein
MVIKTSRPGATGKCRDCWRKGLGKDGRKIEPEEQMAMLLRMMSATIRRSAAEDPGQGLARALRLAAQMADTADDIGVALVAKVGASAVAGDLALDTGEDWDRRRAWSRWGPSSPAAQRRADGYGLTGITEEG